MKSISEIADLFNVSEKTVRNWVTSGALPSFRLAGVCRVSDEQLKAFIAKNASTAQ